ncbi:MAG: single-stranded DNA-binding protein [Desulfocucumaceae bacterium]
MLNNVVIGGRLAHDMELRYTPSGGAAIGKFTLAADRPKYKDRDRETDWIDCVLFGKSAEGLAQYLTKGKPIAVIGSLQTRTWEDNDGKKRKSVEVKVDKVNFLPDGKGKDGAQQQDRQSRDSEFTDVPFTDEEMPF